MIGGPDDRAAPAPAAAGRSPDSDPSPAAATGAPALVLHFWGVRGSVPSPGPATARYGGNTPCVEMRAPDGRRIVLDAGTGLRLLGEDIMADIGPDAEPPRELAVLVSHGHADHVQGLPFFAPLARGLSTLTLYAGPLCAPNVDRAVRSLLQPPLFPAAEAMLARLRVRALEMSPPTRIGGFDVRPVPMAHPGSACGFRVDDPATGRAVAYLPDNELADVAGGDARRALVDSLAGVTVLLHDATYLPAEMGRHRGWGHSSYSEAVQLAADAGVPQLVLFHHHPTRDDAAVDGLVRAAQAMAAAVPGGGPEVTAAAEGTALAL